MEGEKEGQDKPNKDRMVTSLETLLKIQSQDRQENSYWHEENLQWQEQDKQEILQQFAQDKTETDAETRKAHGDTGEWEV